VSTVDKATIKTIQEATYQAGVMVRVSGPNIILSPPLILSDDETTRIISALDEGLSTA